jgi:circadian clock protein KaiC
LQYHPVPGSDEEGERGLEPTGERRATKREERLLEEIESLKRRLQELESRIDAMSGGRKAEEGRIKTFVSGFDEALEGGIPRGHVVVLGGPSGTMKTSLGLNLVHRNGVDGVKGVYVSLEEGRASLLRTMSRLGMEPKDDFIVDIARLRTEHEAADETRGWLKILEEYLQRKREKEPFGLVVIDPLNSLYALAKMADPRTDLFHFFTFLRGLGVTAILIAETSEGSSPFPNHEDFLADGAIQLRYASDADGSVSVEIRCLKMRHANHRRDWFRLEHADGGFVARAPGPSTRP